MVAKVDRIHDRPLKVNILDLLFGDETFPVGDALSLPNLSLESLMLESDVDLVRLESSDWAMASSSRTSNCGEVVWKSGSRCSMNFD